MALTLKNTQIRKFFLLRIHGNDLISTGTDQWMFAAKVAIFLMALAEAFSWGYFGTVLGGEKRKYLIGVSLYIFVFCVIWTLDKALMTLDRYKRHYHEKTYLTDKEESEEGRNIFKDFWKENDTKIGVFARIIVVVLSMIYTAPYLVQFYFDNEIKIAIDKYTQQAIANSRKKLEIKYDTTAFKINKQIEELNKQLKLEVAGKGMSGKYGKGDAANTIEQIIRDKYKVLEQNDTNKKQELNKYDREASNKNYIGLGEIWGVDIPQNSLETRSNVIEPILKSSEGSRASITIQGFLGFIFVALIILKIFEPRGVRIYLSEALQQHYQTYKRGGFDYLINNDERYTGKAPMSPFRFEEFMLVNYYEYITSKQGDEGKRRVEEVLIQIQDKIAQLEEEKSLIEDTEKGELEDAKINLKKIYQDVDKVTEDISSFNSSVTGFENEGSDLKDEIKGLENFISSRPSGTNGRKTVEGHYIEIMNLRNKHKEIIENINHKKANIIELENRLKRLIIEKNLLENKINEIEAPIKALEVRIKEWKRKKSEVIDDRLEKLIEQMKS